MTSFRRTTLLWMTVLLAFVGAIAFAVSFEVARQEAGNTLDDQLRQVAMNVGDGPLELHGPTVKHDAEDDFIIMVWDAAGKQLHPSKNGLILPRQTIQGLATVTALSEDWRVYTASDTRQSVQVAQRMSVRLEMAETAGLQAGLPVLVVIPLAWFVIGWSLSRVLNQTSKLAQSIALRSTNSRELIPVEGVPSEIRPLVDAMNVLTDRLQQALEQQKRFVSDAAHELRSPLTALHLQLGNLQSLTHGDHADLVNELGNGIRRAAAMVEQLLRLARSDESSPRPNRIVLDLTELVTQCVADYIHVATAKNVDLGMGARDSATLSGWPSDLKMLFGNLIDNAIRYTPAGGSIDVSVINHNGSPIVEVLDTGCGVLKADIPRLFDRFFRSAPIDIEGSGLGLSIADAVAKRHGLTIQISNRTDRPGLRVCVAQSAEGTDLIEP